MLFILTGLCTDNKHVTQTVNNRNLRAKTSRSRLTPHTNTKVLYSLENPNVSYLFSEHLLSIGISFVYAFSVCISYKTAFVVKTEKILIPFNAEAAFVQSTTIFENYINPVMLVLIPDELCEIPTQKNIYCYKFINHQKILNADDDTKLHIFIIKRILLAFHHLFT